MDVPRPSISPMSRKPKKGYFVKGHFVEEGSELDLQLRAEQGKDEPSKTDLKRESTELQKLGEALLTLRGDLFARLELPDNLTGALDQLRRITHFEGRRRQLQYVGKLMRQQEPETLQAIRDALEEQRGGSAQQTMALHAAERWRDDLIERDAALTEWLAAHPDTDVQQLRALIRQARKDTQPDPESISKGLAPRRGRAYREIFQLVREAMEAVPENRSEDEFRGADAGGSE